LAFKVRGHSGGAVVVCIKRLHDLVDVLGASLVVCVFQMVEDKFDVGGKCTFVVSIITEEGPGDGFRKFKIYCLFNVGLPYQRLKELRMFFLFSNDGCFNCPSCFMTK